MRLTFAAPDAGDPLLNSWILWWDQHQTFSGATHLFDANIFFPLKNTLAFSEHCYGVALLTLPLFALGASPIMVSGAATLLGFALCGYGAFRLVRAATDSWYAGLLAGILFAFTPYRFAQLSHLPYVCAGWLPLLFEALIRYARQRSGRRAFWLGAVFFLNGLTSIHWLVLSAIPFVVVAAFLFFRHRVPASRVLLAIAAVAVAAGALLPFLLPYRTVAREYGFVRNSDEALRYSATAGDWLKADGRNRFWRGALPPAEGERNLFPGAMAPLLAAAAVVGWRRTRGAAAGEERSARGDGAIVAVVLTLFGIFGSLGLRTPFYRLAFDGVSVFRSVRVPARCAMLGHLGLAVGAGLGVTLVLGAIPGRRGRQLAAVCLMAAGLVELRAAPLDLVRVPNQADGSARFLRGSPMTGGVVELPGTKEWLYLYTLRAAFHGRPLVNAVSGFEPATTRRIRELSEATPVTDLLIDVLETVPTSFVVVHEEYLTPERLSLLRVCLARAISQGRLRFVSRFDAADDVYAVVSNEPGARGLQPLPWRLESSLDFGSRLPDDPGLLGSLDEPREGESVRGPVVIRGWARVPAEDLGVSVAIDGVERGVVAQRIPRPDVCRVVPRLGECDRAGFELRLEVPPGAHEAALVLRSAAGKSRRLPVRRFSVAR